MKTLVVSLMMVCSFWTFAQTEKETTPKNYVENPDTEAEYIGGVDAMYQFIANQVKYPSEAIEKEIQGTVYTRFMVDQDGSISDISVMRSPDEMLSKEATRLIESMPKWKPGTLEGKAVRTVMVLPVNFRLV